MTIENTGGEFEFPLGMPPEVAQVARELHLGDFAVGIFRGAQKMDMDLNDPRTVEDMISYLKRAHDIDN